MASTVATAVVKIAADIGDFDKGLQKAQKQLLRTADAMESYGKKLTVGFTAPLVAASAMLAKSAAEDAASLSKLDRAFGSSAAGMEKFIGQMMKVTPATDDSLRQLVANTQAFNLSLGMTPAKATAMTQAITRLAADVAAYNHVELGVAQDAIQNAIAGKTKALTGLNIVVSAAEVKARGLAAIETKAAAMRGEAARTINEDANAWKRFEQSLDGASDAMGQAVLPTFAKVLDVAAKMAQTIAGLDPTTKGLIVGIGAVAAGMGPALIVAANLTRAWVMMKAAVLALTSTGGLAGLAALVTPGGALLVGLAALGFLLYRSGAAARQAKSDMDDYKVALGGATKAQLQQTQAQLAGNKASLMGKLGLVKGQLSQLDPNKPSQMIAFRDASTEKFRLEKQIAAIQGPLDAANGALAAMNRQEAQAAELAGGIAGAFDMVGEASKRLDAIWTKLANNRIWDDFGTNGLGAAEAVKLPGAGMISSAASTPRAGVIPASVIAGVQAAKITETYKSVGDKQTAALNAGFATVAVAIGDTLANNLANAFGGGRGAQIGGSILGAAGGAAAGQLLGKGAGAVLGSVVPVIGTIAGTFLGSAIGSLFDHKRAVNENTQALNRLSETMNGPAGFKVEPFRFRATQGAPSFAGATFNVYANDPSSFMRQLNRDSELFEARGGVAFANG